MTVTLAPAATSPRGDAVATRPSRFRPDVDGLRAIAILLVVGYHAQVPGMGAGFIGVDVFFVISGFLITTVLVDEMDATGTVLLRRFWARRARRLLPAASVVTVFCLLAGMTVLSPLDWAGLANEGLATTTYWSNVLFGLRAADYFGAGVRSSPFLHTWSLSVEEQFYLVWPVLLLLMLHAGRVAGADLRRFRLLALGVVTAASFALSLSLTGQKSPWAFFSSMSRAWELGAGALLALTLPALAGLRPKLRATLQPVGLGILVAAIVAIDGSTPFPGWAATLPVLATLALIAGGPGQGALGRLLAARPLQAVGRMSYSWYLWHWPVLVLGVSDLAGSSLTTRLTLVLLSLVPAALTHRFVENPIRHSAALTASPARTLGLVSLIVVVTLGVGLSTRARAAEARREPRLHALAVARADRPPLDQACATTDLARLEEHCLSGDPTGRATILVLGDSHAAHWLPAIDGAARQLGVRVISSLQGSCPSLSVASTDEYPSCGVRRRLLPGLVHEVRPQLVLVSHSVGYIGGLAGPSGGKAAPERQLALWSDALEQLATGLRATGTPLGVILDTPRLPGDPIDCLARHREPGRCDVALTEVLGPLASFHAAESDGLRRAGHGSALDPLTFLCDGERCPVAPHGTVAYVDSHHLTAGYSAALASRIRPFLEHALSTSAGVAG